MLQLTDIRHSFEGQPVLDGVCLSLKPGERLALMGPSGVGKTTLLRIVLGLLRPDSGDVRNRFSNPAIVFQDPRLLPWRTALENVNLVLGDKKTTLPRALDALQAVELEQSADLYPNALSGGMQQRVALARALAVNPDLLVLDEPFKGMDDALRRRMIARLDQTNAAILLVTHDPLEARSLHCRVQTL